MNLDNQESVSKSNAITHVVEHEKDMKAWPSFNASVLIPYDKKPLAYV